MEHGHQDIRTDLSDSRYSSARPQQAGNAEQSGPNRTGRETDSHSMAVAEHVNGSNWVSKENCERENGRSDTQNRPQGIPWRSTRYMGRGSQRPSDRFAVERTSGQQWSGNVDNRFGRRQPDERYGARRGYGWQRTAFDRPINQRYQCGDLGWEHRRYVAVPSTNQRSLANGESSLCNRYPDEHTPNSGCSASGTGKGLNMAQQDELGRNDAKQTSTAHEPMFEMLERGCVQRSLNHLAHDSDSTTAFSAVPSPLPSQVKQVRSESEAPQTDQQSAACGRAALIQNKSQWSWMSDTTTNNVDSCRDNSVSIYLSGMSSWCRKRNEAETANEDKHRPTPSKHGDEKRIGGGEVAVNHSNCYTAPGTVAVPAVSDHQRSAYSTERRGDFGARRFIGIEQRQSPNSSMLPRSFPIAAEVGFNKRGSLYGVRRADGINVNFSADTRSIFLPYGTRTREEPKCSSVQKMDPKASKDGARAGETVKRHVQIERSEKGAAVKDDPSLAGGRETRSRVEGPSGAVKETVSVAVLPRESSAAPCAEAFSQTSPSQSSSRITSLPLTPSSLIKGICKMRIPFNDCRLFEKLPEMVRSANSSPIIRQLSVEQDGFDLSALKHSAPSLVTTHPPSIANDIVETDAHSHPQMIDAVEGKATEDDETPPPKEKETSCERDRSCQHCQDVISDVACEEGTSKGLDEDQVQTPANMNADSSSEALSSESSKCWKEGSARCHVSMMDVLSEEIWHLHTTHMESEISLVRKLHLREVLHSSISQLFPMCGLYIVGSSLNGFGSKSSDMDLCLMISHRELNQRTDAMLVLEMIRGALVSVHSIVQHEVIPAKVPILRLKLSGFFEGMTVDVNVNNSVAIRNTHLMHYYALFDWRVSPIVSVVKEWAKHRHMNNANRSTFTSYSLVLMVIHYFQCGVNPPILPSLQSLYPSRFDARSDVRHLDMSLELDPPPTDQWSFSATQTLGELLIGFLHYYAYQFDYIQDAISVRLGKKSDRAVVARQRSKFNSMAQWNCICIEEPFTLSNTAHSIHSQMVFDAIREAFIDGFKELDENRDLHAFLNAPPICIQTPCSSSAHLNELSTNGHSDTLPYVRSCPMPLTITAWTSEQEPSADRHKSVQVECDEHALTNTEHSATKQPEFHLHSEQADAAMPPVPQLEKDDAKSTAEQS